MTGLDFFIFGAEVGAFDLITSVILFDNYLIGLYICQFATAWLFLYRYFDYDTNVQWKQCYYYATR